MKHLLLRRIAAVAAVFVCAVGVSGASPSSSNDPTDMTTSDDGRRRLWYDQFGDPWCGGPCGGYCCLIVPVNSAWAEG